MIGFPAEEEVNGIVIGDMPPVHRGRLYYGGRPQSDWLRASSEAELIEAARERKHELLNECGEVAYQIWPDDSKWQLRIYE